MKKALNSLPPEKSSMHIAFRNLYPDPTFNVQRGAKWINYGITNDAYDYIDSLIDYSPTHAAILYGTTLFAQGNGLIVPENNLKAQAMYSNGETNLISPNDLDHIQAKLFRDLVVYGACLLNIRWSKDRSRIADVHYVDVRTMRIDSNYEGYWISADWKNWKKEENTPEFFPAFTSEEGGSQLLYIKLPNARQTPYGMPSYWSGRQAIELQNELQKLNLNRVRNNFFASVIIKFGDIPTPEEQDATHKNLKKFFGGSEGDNVGGAMLLYGSNVEIEKFESAVVPEDFNLLQKTSDNQIRAAHRLEIFGSNNKEGISFTSGDDLLNQVEAYTKLVVRPLQLTVLSVWNMIGQINKIDHTWEIAPFTMNGEDTTNNTGDAAAQDASAAMPAVGAPDVASVQATALNGAQVDSLKQIINEVGEGVLTPATARALIRAAFPALSIELIDEMLNGVTAVQPLPSPTNPDNNVI